MRLRSPVSYNQEDKAGFYAFLIDQNNQQPKTQHLTVKITLYKKLFKTYVSNSSKKSEKRRFKLIKCTIF